MINKKRIKMAKLVSVIFFLFFLTGCSVLENLVSRIPFWDANQEPGLLEKDAARFGHSVITDSHADLYYRQGCYYQKQKKHKLAVKEFQKVVRADPTHIRAFNRMGISYDFLGEYASAAQSYEAALKLNPDRDDVLNNLGYCYLLQGNNDRAIETFHKAIAVNDKNSRSRNNLGLAYAEKGMFEDALAEFRQAGDEAAAHYQIAQIYYKHDLFNEAKNHFAKTLSFNPSLENARAGLEASAALARIYADKAGKGKTFGGKEKKSTGYNRIIIRENSEISIEVSNGNGVNRMAARVGRYLRKKGFKVIRLTNADNFHHPETRIYYCDTYLHDAYRVAEKIPGYQDMEKVKAFDRPGINIKILLGRDLIWSDAMFAEGEQYPGFKKYYTLLTKLFL